MSGVYYINSKVMKVFLLLVIISSALGSNHPTTVFTATLGAKNGVPSRKYQFAKVKLGSTKGNYNDLMIRKCKSLGMKPVCDSPYFCNRDPNSIYLGQSHQLIQRSQRQDKNDVPSGFSKIVHYWDGLCSYASSYATKMNRYATKSTAVCEISATRQKWMTPQQANPGFICAKVVHTSITHKHVVNFTATLGAKSGVPSRKYQFAKVKLGSTKGNYDALMIKKCKSLGMKPVCEHPYYCKRDSNSIYLGQSHHLVIASYREKKLVPSGFSKIAHYWDGLCGYADQNLPITGMALCNIPATSYGWKTPQQANPGFICAKVVDTSITHKHVVNIAKRLCKKDYKNTLKAVAKRCKKNKRGLGCQMDQVRVVCASRAKLIAQSKRAAADSRKLHRQARQYRAVARNYNRRAKIHSKRAAASTKSAKRLAAISKQHNAYTKIYSRHQKSYLNQRAKHLRSAAKYSRAAAAHARKVAHHRNDKARAFRHAANHASRAAAHLKKYYNHRRSHKQQLYYKRSYESTARTHKHLSNKALKKYVSHMKKYRHYLSLSKRFVGKSHKFMRLARHNAKIAKAHLKQAHKASARLNLNKEIHREYTKKAAARSVRAAKYSRSAAQHKRNYNNHLRVRQYYKRKAALHGKHERSASAHAADGRRSARQQKSHAKHHLGNARVHAYHAAKHANIAKHYRRKARAHSDNVDEYNARATAYKWLHKSYHRSANKKQRSAKAQKKEANKKARKAEGLGL